MMNLNLPMTVNEMEQAWSARDAAFDGRFVFGCKTTGIYCRPSCPSQPKRENIEFFHAIKEALLAGYRPCKRCQPELASGEPPAWVADLMQRVQDAPERRWQAEDLREVGVAPERARRWFLKHRGMTFGAWARAIRLGHAFTRIRNGDELDEVLLGHGYDSHSGFREAFGKLVGAPPGRAKKGTHNVLFAQMLSTPLGPMVAVAGDAGVALLEFTDVRGLERQFSSMRKKLGMPVVPGQHPMLDRLQNEVARYYRGELQTFSVPLQLAGSDFQKLVWNTLAKLPYGETISYQELAIRVGNKDATRAVARANGLNRLYLLVPCHRVIGKDGNLGGYGGGLWRKQQLLDIENRNL